MKTRPSEEASCESALVTGEDANTVTVDNKASRGEEVSKGGGKNKKSKAPKEGKAPKLKKGGRQVRSEGSSDSGIGGHQEESSSLIHDTSSLVNDSNSLLNDSNNSSVLINDAERRDAERRDSERRDAERRDSELIDNDTKIRRADSSASSGHKSRQSFSSSPTFSSLEREGRNAKEEEDAKIEDVNQKERDEKERRKMTTGLGINKDDEDTDQRGEGSDEEEEDANGNRTRIVRSDEPVHFRPDGSGNGREEWSECIKDESIKMDLPERGESSMEEEERDRKRNRLEGDAEDEEVEESPEAEIGDVKIGDAEGKYEEEGEGLSPNHHQSEDGNFETTPKSSYQDAYLDDANLKRRYQDANQEHESYHQDDDDANFTGYQESIPYHQNDDGANHEENGVNHDDEDVESIPPPKEFSNRINDDIQEIDDFKTPTLKSPILESPTHGVPTHRVPTQEISTREISNHEISTFQSRRLSPPRGSFPNEDEVTLRRRKYEDDPHHSQILPHDSLGVSEGVPLDSQGVSEGILLDSLGVSEGIPLDSLGVLETFPLASEDSRLKRGLLWQLKNGGSLFSRWKERYFILTPDYLSCFKKRNQSSLASKFTSFNLSNTPSIKSDMGSFSYKLKLLDIESIEWKSSSDCSSKSLRRKNRKLINKDISARSLNKKSSISPKDGVIKRRPESVYIESEVNLSGIDNLGMSHDSNYGKDPLNSMKGGVVEGIVGRVRVSPSPSDQSVGSNTSHKEVIQINVSILSKNGHRLDGKKRVENRTIDLWSASRRDLNEWIFLLKQAMERSRGRREALIKKSQTTGNLPVNHSNPPQSTAEEPPSTPFAISSSSYWIMTRDEKSKFKRDSSSSSGAQGALSGTQGLNHNPSFLSRFNNGSSNDEQGTDGSSNVSNSDLKRIHSDHSSGHHNLRSSQSYSNNHPSMSTNNSNENGHNKNRIGQSLLSTSITVDRINQRHSSSNNQHPTPSMSAHAHLDSPAHQSSIPQVPTRNTSVTGFMNGQCPGVSTSDLPTSGMSTSGVSTSGLSGINHQAFATSSRVLASQARNRDATDPEGSSNNYGLGARGSDQHFLPSRLVATEGRKRGGAKGKTILDPRFEEPVQLSDLSHLTPSRLALVSNGKVTCNIGQNSSNGYPASAHGQSGISSLVSLDRRHRNSVGSDRSSVSSSASGLERRTLLRNAAAVAAASGQSTSIFGFPLVGTNPSREYSVGTNPSREYSVGTNPSREYSTGSEGGRRGNDGHFVGISKELHQQTCPKSLLISPALTQRSLYAQQLLDQSASNQSVRPQSSASSSGSSHHFCTTSRGWTKDDLLVKFGKGPSSSDAKSDLSKNDMRRRDSAQSAGSEFSFHTPKDTKSKQPAFLNRPLPPTPDSNAPPRPPLPRESSLSRTHAQPREGNLTRISSSSSVFLPSVNRQSFEDSSTGPNYHYHPSLARDNHSSNNGRSRFGDAQLRSDTDTRFGDSELVPGLDVNQIRGKKERLLFMLSKDGAPVHFGSCSNVRPSSYHNHPIPPNPGDASGYRYSSGWDGSRGGANLSMGGDSNEGPSSNYGDENFDELIRKLKLNQAMKRAQEKQWSSASTTNTPNKHASGHASFFGPVSFGTGSRIGGAHRDFQGTGFDGRPYEAQRYQDWPESSSRMYQTEGRYNQRHQAEDIDERYLHQRHLMEEESRQKSLDPDYDAFTSAASPARAARKNSRMNRILEKNCVQYSN